MRYHIDLTGTEVTHSRGMKIVDEICLACLPAPLHLCTLNIFAHAQQTLTNQT